MNKPTIEQIHTVMRSQGMVVFDAPFSITLGGIRANDNKANTFNDFLFASYFDDNGKLNSVIIPATTDAGLTYRLKPMNKKGTAIVKHGIQHKGCYRYENPLVNKGQHGHNGKEAFRQVKPMAYWRDNDKNPFLGESDQMPNFEKYPTEISVSATNLHDMGTVGVHVNNWSAGCGGSTETNMDKLYSFAKIQIKAGLGDIFSYALLHESMF